MILKTNRKGQETMTRKVILSHMGEDLRIYEAGDDLVLSCSNIDREMMIKPADGNEFRLKFIKNS